jgi:LytS/YehU family sensor histidine kinase
VVLLARRLAGDGIRNWRNWMVVLAGSVAVMAVHGLIHTWATWLLGIDSGSGTGPHSLIDYAQRHGGGDLATFSVLVGGYLLFDANRRATARELAASELSARLAKADLELLRWNLHPHFLFNALNTVSTLVMKGANDDAGRTISLISRYLRSGMAQRADSMVTLSEDVALVKRYLEIESLRFGDSLRIEVDADADALEATLPGSILQPLVENAIAHGTVREAGSRPIRIDARIIDDRLLVSVSNPSNGDAPGHRATDADSARFGLRYVRERLRQFYGDDARFDLLMNAFETTATLDVPVREASG